MTIKTKSNRRSDRTVTELPKKSRSYTYKTLIFIRDGHYASSISRQLRIPKQTVNDRIARLIHIGFIRLDIESSAKFYKLTKKGYEFIRDYKTVLSRYSGGIGKTRMHRLNIKFKIVEDKGISKFEKEHSMNNWVQKYTRLKFPLGITIQKNPNSVVAMFHEFETKKESLFTDFFSHVMRGSYYVYYYLMVKQGITIDVPSGEITDQHIANEEPNLQGKLDDKKITTLELNRKAKGFFDANFKAKSWVDQSKGLPEIETNDLLYEERLLRMPETLDNIDKSLVPTLQALNQEIRMHLVVMQDIRDTMKEMRKEMKK